MYYFLAIGILITAAFLKLSICITDSGYSVSLLGIRLAKSRENKDKSKGKSKLTARIIIKEALESHSKLKLESLRVSYKAADSDPYAAVQRYSLAQLAAAITEKIEIKEKRIDISLDFESEKQELRFCIRLSLRGYMAFGIVLRLGKAVLQNSTKQRKDLKYGKQTGRNDADGDGRCEAAC